MNSEIEMLIEDKDFLEHYGVKRRSGRYPYGSGEDPYQHSGDFISRVHKLKTEQGLTTEKDICEALGMKSTQYRTLMSAAKHERKMLMADRARSLLDDGYNRTEVAKKLGFNNESSIRSLLNESSLKRASMAQNTADVLEKELNKKKMLDVGKGVERELGVSDTKKKEALYLLEAKGYKVHEIKVEQVTNRQNYTTMKVLTDGNTTKQDILDNIGNVNSVADYHSVDGGKTFNKIEYPASINSNRVKIRYAEEGGKDMDGTIQIRRGVEDLNLGNSSYAQVRILVDGTHYLKGMAVYSDGKDMPAGTDIIFNTNKTLGTPKEKVLKSCDKNLAKNPDDPFGATIKAEGQSWYTDKNGNEKLSAINKLKEEGDWDDMSKNVSQQFLSKQPISLIRSQLNETKKTSKLEYDEIMSLQNPTLKKKMLLDYADECDSAAVHLKAAAFPRQKTEVLLPFTSIKDNEIYAPNYQDGEKLALIRYPHGGTFEIPVLTVNNKNPQAKKTIGNAIDAVGINSKVAERLSGADFDGDQVVTIPFSGKGRIDIKSTKPLKGLEGFDPKTEYSTEGKTGVKLMAKGSIGREMGMISNLITDMTLGGANEQEITRAVRHSMVVIDAHKHELDYKQSEKDHGIQELRKRYQRHIDPETGEVKYGGASTLLSMRKQEVNVPERRGSMQIDPTTGEGYYKTTGDSHWSKKEQAYVPNTERVSRMSVTKDARTLSSGTAQEDAYADYANYMKAMGNTARKSALATSHIDYNPQSKQKYDSEVKSLKAKLAIAEANAPKERRAQVLASAVVKAAKDDNPNLDKKEIKKISQLAIQNARATVGASGKDSRINITDNEWKAIQSGAIHHTTLMKIFDKADSKQLRSLALPKTTTNLTPSQEAKIKAMVRSGYSTAQIADRLGCSVSAIYDHM